MVSVRRPGAHLSFHLGSGITSYEGVSVSSVSCFPMQEVPFVPAAGSCSLHVVGFVVDNQGRLNASHCQQHISDPPEAPAPVIAPVVEKGISRSGCSCG